MFDLPLPAIGIFWAWVSLLLFTYSLPWMVNPGSGLTVNAYDLAEWVSLSPAVRAQPLLYTALFLRLPLVLITWSIALAAPQPNFRGMWLSHAVACFLMVSAQLPPLEFLTQPNDPNYQQQFGLACFSLAGASLSISGRLKAVRFWLIQVFAIVATVTLALGYEQAARTIQSFHLPGGIGLGFMGMLGLWSLWVIAGGLWLVTRSRAAITPP